MTCPVTDFSLKPLGRCGETAGHGSGEVKDGHIAPLFGLLQRDEYLPLETVAVTVHGDTGTALVVGEDLALSPGLVLVGDDVVLEKTHLLPPLQLCLVSQWVLQLQDGVVLQDFVHPLVPFAAQLPVNNLQNSEKYLKCLTGQEGENPS